MFNLNDFNVVVVDGNGHSIRIEDLNKMVEYGAITINREKLEEYKTETRTRVLGVDSDINIMEENKCKGCKYDLIHKTITDKSVFNTILDMCSACKRGVLEEYQDKFLDMYTIEE